MTTTDGWDWTFVIPREKLLLTDPADFPPKIHERHFAPIDSTVPVLESVQLHALNPMHSDEECDCCGEVIRAGTSVISKGLNMRAGMMVGGGSSHTCLPCAFSRPAWLAWFVLGA